MRLTLRRGVDVGLDAFHPLALLLRIRTASNERLLHLLRLGQEGIHLLQDSLRGILYVFEDAEIGKGNR